MGIKASVEPTIDPKEALRHVRTLARAALDNGEADEPAPTPNCSTSPAPPLAGLFCACVIGRDAARHKIFYDFLIFLLTMKYD